MKLSIARILGIGSVLFVGAPGAFAAQGASVDDIKQILEQQGKLIRELQARIEELEAEAKPEVADEPEAVAAEESTEPARGPLETQEPIAEAQPEKEGLEGLLDAAKSTLEGEAPSPAEEAEAKRYGRKARVTYRRTLSDQQTAAARPEDLTLNPEYRGFLPIPNTVFMIQFNARPRVDLIGDSSDPGTDFRFVPSQFPSSNTGGWRVSANANASQLRIDLRAPEYPGDFRFFYQNDFFGSNSSNMQYRLQHLYGEYYGVVAGFTFGVFEDPDAWPDTVDYEGPNSVIFARRAVLQYKKSLSEDWQLTFGVEDPDIFVDTTGDPDAKQLSRAPDTGVNLRWMPGELGHMQFSAIARSISVESSMFSNDDVFGWGVNTSGSLNLWADDTLQYWFVYGRGVGGMGNDTSFIDSDAAFSASGNLRALEYWSTMVAMTHHWTPRWRTTLTHGFVNLQNTDLQAPDAYHQTQYASLNLVYRVFKRFSIGLEGLYGFKEVNDGSDTDIFRIQLGLAFSIFD